MARKGKRAGVPVLCVGNFTLGGAGKTPAAIAIATMLAAGGRAGVLPQPRLWRQHRGAETGRRRMPIMRAEVGDEALLLARVAPTIVARDRVAGASLAKAQGATVVRHG